MSSLQPASDPLIARSWQRCAEQHQLDPGQWLAPCVLEHGRMLERREYLQPLLRVASGEMHNLQRQLAGDGHALLLTDAQGVILECLAAASDRPLFQRAGLWLGADWSEAGEGTNGIGTCLVERQPLTIHRQEHFRQCHSSLSCSAAPLFDDQGELLAVLDLSSVREAPSRQQQFHSMALVNLSAKVIESAYFLRCHEQHWLLRFHPQGECLGLFSEGLLAFDEQGRVLAANAAAVNLLGHSQQALRGQSLEQLFACTLGQLLAQARRQPRLGWPLYRHDGHALFALLRQPARQANPATRCAPLPGQVVARRGPCLRDPRLQRALQQGLRAYERDLPLLLQGETGVGKEVFAKALHQISSRAQQPFVALNCAALPESLIESELFGYQGGSFTGARKEGMRGKLLQAQGGTLLLDEIGDMPLALQTRLLRVLEERQVEPLGGHSQALDVRVISASHHDLAQRVASGQFRADLYYRLHGLALALPALREREDRAALLDSLLAEEAQSSPPPLSEACRRTLLDYSWPGNVRQLRHVLRGLLALHEGGTLHWQALPAELRQASPPPEQASAGALQQAERQALLDSLQAYAWNVSDCARQLGLSRNTLYRKLQRHGIRRH